MAIMMSFVACSDDIFDAPENELPSDGKLTVSLGVPAMKKVATRANENAVGDVLMFVFNSENKLKQVESWTGLDTQTVTIAESLRKDGGMQFFFVANSGLAKTAFSIDAGIDDVKKKLMSEVVIGDNMVMSGIASLPHLLKMETVWLYRNAAKVSVHGNDTGKTPYPFVVLGSASQSYMMAGAFCNEGNNSDLLGAPSDVTFPPSIADDRTAAVYLHPTENTGGNLTKSYIIVKADYNGKPNYYRLDFQKKNETTNEIDVLDLLPNHHYEVTILGEPQGPGYADPEAASKNPTPLSSNWYKIDDHAPVIFNMVTDGSHELGVSHRILNTQLANNTTEDLYVKVYSIDNPSEEADFATNYSSLITFDKSFVSLAGTIEEVTSGDNNADLVDIADVNNGGKIYRIPLKFNQTGDFGDGTATGKVVWQGLSREFEIVWDRTFNPSNLLKATYITIKNGDNGTVVDHQLYFDQLADDGATLNAKGFITDNVWGVSAADNNGNARDNGFHFPVMYGETDKLWTYEYDVEFEPLAEKAYSWSARLVGDPGVTGNVEIKSVNSPSLTAAEGPKLCLTTSGQSWDYGTGYLEITVTVDGKAQPPFEVPVYHTGFFHKDVISGSITAYENIDNSGNLRTASILKGTGDNSKYTYYEVVSMGDRHWLDRNVGAHSAGLYIENSDGTAYIGDNSAAGYYYRVAGYKKYESPVMNTSMCPPGYTIPTEIDFNQVRASSGFSTAQMGNYYTASYRVSDEKTVYFPKARYYNSTSADRVGDARAGYYWTSSAASGTEKEEIGAWLKCLNFNGTASSYINGEVVCPTVGNASRNATDGFAMAVRCVNKDERTTEYKTTNFFVKGATHIFLYKEEGGVRTPVFPWPGQAIGTYNSVNSDYFNFYYESATVGPEDLYVIFNYKQENGQIISYSANASNKQNFRRTDSANPSSLVGWKVVGDITPASGTVSNVGGKWTILDNSISFNISIYDPNKVSTYRLYFKYNQWDKLKGVNLYNDDLGWKAGVTIWSDWPNTQSCTNGTYYRYNSGDWGYLQFTAKPSELPGTISFACPGEGNWGTFSSTEFVPNSEGIYEATMKAETGNPVVGGCLAE